MRNADTFSNGAGGEMQLVEAIVASSGVRVDISRMHIGAALRRQHLVLTHRPRFAPTPAARRT